jgi:hypothetical protein
VAKSDQYDLPFRTSVGKEAGGVDDLKVFASEEAAKRLVRHPEGLAFGYEVMGRSRLPKRNTRPQSDLKTEF